MGISSFAAGFLESAAERIDTREKEAREVNRIRSERQLKDFTEATKIKKAKRLEFKNNVQQIERALNSTNKSLSSTAIISIATDKTRMTQFLNLAKSNPQELDQYIKADEDPNLTLAQQVELAAERATPDVAPIAEETYRAFGLPGADVSAPIKAGAAAAGVTEEQFKTGLTPTVPTAPEFREDLTVAQQTTMKASIDQAQLELSSLIQKEQDDPKSVTENEINSAKIRLSTLNKVQKGAGGGELSISEMTSLVDGSVKNITANNPFGTQVGKKVTIIPQSGRLTVKPNQTLNKNERRELARQYLELLDPLMQNVGIVDKSKDWYNKETLEINFANLYPHAGTALTKHSNILMPSIPATTGSVNARANRKITINNKTITQVSPSKI